MTNALATQNGSANAVAMERVIVQGDLSTLTAEQRTGYYNAVCESVGMNPLTKPFEYLKLNGKTVLYARREGVEQLRKIHGVSLRIVKRETAEGLHVVTVQATDRDGRVDEAIGVVSIKGLSGDNLANALMKSETKAKRRATLSIVGLGFLEESQPERVEPPQESFVDAIEEAEIVPESKSLPQGQKQWPARPFSADDARAWLLLKANEDNTRAEPGDLRALFAALGSIRIGSGRKITDEDRRIFTSYCFGFGSLKEANESGVLTKGICKAIYSFIVEATEPNPERPGAFVFIPYATIKQEFEAIIAAYNAIPRDAGLRDGLDTTGEPLPETALFDGEGASLATPQSDEGCDTARPQSETT